MRNRKAIHLPSSQKGFTLFEIIVAISIFAIVVGLVVGSFGTMFKNADRLNRGTDIYEMGNICMERITKDLKSIHVASYPRYNPPDIEDEPEIYHVKGESRNVSGQSFGWLRFTSMAHLPLNQEAYKGISEIVYYVQLAPEGNFILRRSDKLYPYPEEFEEKETDPILCEHLQHFKIVYYDAEGNAHDEWDSESDDVSYGTPRAIEITFTIGTEEINHTFTSQISLPVYRYKEVKR